MTRNTWTLSPDHADLRRPERPARPLTIPAAPQRLTLDLARTALLVIDLQNDFCHPDGWLSGIGVDTTPTTSAVTGVREFLPVLRAADVPIVWVNWGNRPDRANLPPGVLHVYDPAGADTGIGSPATTSSTAVLQEDSWGAAIVDELDSATTDIHIDKYRMSGFVDTALDSVLRNLRVDTLLFAGVNVDQCVLATLMDAANLGYDVVLLTDAAATTSPAYCLDATIYNVRQCFGFTATASDLADAMAEHSPAQ
ncbi:cysteine hydrolase family protein [Nocardia macrotermitis]|uniref:Peroxyureidoacrylate/ureidoacrylate amidohydrolase RutB n=1 Tax=Nocardia macrotermitis TaxID=2585198 RepID=A0A7K0CZK3_9NOCA|nr:isochorismatase family cysteine hydrolase [Nocardia macrotermitis]MQY18382.1 Peroxyureidoacrylate/ureidoacrylate amidohydrolase RutB [Nocardia macrotermitis]